MARIFSNADEAKDFLVAKIIAQAKGENISLSDAEQKMMYYSVEKPSVADEVADQFGEDRTEEYEGKIRSLARDAFRHDEAERADCLNAYRELSKGDHYLAILAGSILEPTFNEVPDGLPETDLPPRKGRPALDRLWLFLTGLAVTGVLMVVMFYWQLWKESFWYWFNSHLAK